MMLVVFTHVFTGSPEACDFTLTMRVHIKKKQNGQSNNRMSRYIPERNHIIYLDFEPTKGKEIGKYHPAFVWTNNKRTVDETSKK